MRRLALVVMLAVGVPGALAQNAPARSSEKLPPLSYTCPMHPDVVEDKAGECPICRMKLEPVRLAAVWTCPGQPGLGTQDKPGRCPTDGRDLVQMTMALTFTCADSKTESLNMGTCSDGSPMIRHYTLRPHGNHNPQHGGQFFMAPDNWHHLEGTYLPSGVFRIYLYDDFTKPLAMAQVRAMLGRVLLQNKTGSATELKLVRNGRVLEARVGKLPFPTEMQARVKFQAEAPEHLFDFTFENFSKDPSAAPAITRAGEPGGAAAPPSAPKASASPASGTPTTPAVGAGATSPGTDASSSAAPIPDALLGSNVDPALITMPIPETVPEMLAQLRTRSGQIKGLIDRGAFAGVYVPAFQAKDLALALDSHEADLSEDRRAALGPAVSRVVRSAYLLDAFGDLGNKQQITEAYAQFAAAVKDIESAFPSPEKP